MTETAHLTADEIDAIARMIDDNADWHKRSCEECTNGRQCDGYETFLELVRDLEDIYADPTPVHCPCGRRLTATASRERGYGPRCWQRIRRDAETIDLSMFADSGAARTKAIDLIEQRGVIVVNRRREICRTVSIHGDAQYITTIHGCSCTAGQRLGRCNHRVAVMLILGIPTPYMPRLFAIGGTATPSVSLAIAA